MEGFWYIFYMKESESIYQVSSWALEIFNQIRSLRYIFFMKESESIYLQVSSWALEIINQIRSLSNDILVK